MIESMQSLGMDKFRVAFTRFLAFYSAILLDFKMAKLLRNGKVRQISPLTPRPKLEGRQIFKHDSVAEGLNYTMICRRVCKCEPLLRFNPLNLAKIVCFTKWVKGAKCVSSVFVSEKVLMILTCNILKIKAQLNQLVNWKLWVALFYPEQSVEF